MRTRTSALSVLPLAVVLAASGCTAEAPPPPAGGSTPGAAAEPQAPTIVPVEDPAAVLEVEDQKSEGPTVLARAAASKGGFIVVYADEGRNELGSGIVPPGCTAEAPPPAPGAAPGGGSAAPEPQAPTIVPVEDPAAVLEVADQKSEGPTVLAKAAASKGGFIVVYADEGRNELGSGIVPPGGTATDIQVSLAEEPTEEIALLARLFADTDGNGLFSAGDMPVTNGKDDADDDTEVFLGEQDAFSFTGKKVVNS